MHLTGWSIVSRQVHVAPELEAKAVPLKVRGPVALADSPAQCCIDMVAKRVYFSCPHEASRYMTVTCSTAAGTTAQVGDELHIPYDI